MTVLATLARSAWTGAALFGLIVAWLGGATASLALAFWGLGLIAVCACDLATAQRRRRES